MSYTQVKLAGFDDHVLSYGIRLTSACCGLAPPPRYSLAARVSSPQMHQPLCGIAVLDIGSHYLEVMERRNDS